VAPTGAQGVSTTNVDDEAEEIYETTARITAVSPAVLSGAGQGICVRPDGSVRNNAANAPVTVPVGDTSYGAGDVVILVQDNDVTVSGESATYVPRGVPYRVILPYNGIPRVSF
jgi:hypothetical protein